MKKLSMASVLAFAVTLFACVPSCFAHGFLVHRGGGVVLINGNVPVNGAIYNAGFGLNRFGVPVDAFGRPLPGAVRLNRFGVPVNAFGQPLSYGNAGFQVQVFRSRFGSQTSFQFNRFGLPLGVGGVPVFQNRFVPGFGIVPVRIR